MSWVFAPEITIDRGSPFSSVRTLRFVPIFSSVRWILPNGLQCQRCFYHTAVQTLPLPADPFQFIVLFQPFAPDFFKESRCLPFLEPSVYRAGTSVFPGQCLPLTPGSQHIEYPLQRFPCRHWFPSLTRCVLVFLCRIPFPFRYLLFRCNLKSLKMRKQFPQRSAPEHIEKTLEEAKCFL